MYHRASLPARRLAPTIERPVSISVKSPLVAALIHSFCGQACGTAHSKRWQTRFQAGRSPNFRTG